MLADMPVAEVPLRYRGVFFDIDGTLLGVRPEPEVFYEQVCQEVGVDCTERLTQARSIALDFFHQHGLAYLHDERKMWWEANRRVFSFLGLGDRAADCATRFQALFYRSSEQFLYPDVKPALEGLRERGYLMGALTGRLHSSENVLRALEVRPFFAFYLYAGELGVLKPDPRLYQTALQRAGLPPASIVLVGDHPSDVQGARSVGLTPVLIARGQRAHHGDVKQVSDLQELLPWLDAAS